MFKSLIYAHTLTHTQIHTQAQKNSPPEANLPRCPMLERHQRDYQCTSDVPAGSKGIHFGTDCQA